MNSRCASRPGGCRNVRTKLTKLTKSPDRDSGSPHQGCKIDPDRPENARVKRYEWVMLCCRIRPTAHWYGDCWFSQLSPLFHRRCSSFAAKSFVSSRCSNFRINYLSILPPPGLMRRAGPSFSPACLVLRLRLAGFFAGGLFLKLSKTASSRGRTERSLLR